MNLLRSFIPPELHVPGRAPYKLSQLCLYIYFCFTYDSFAQLNGDLTLSYT